jgi:hypothetical protein
VDSTVTCIKQIHEIIDGVFVAKESSGNSESPGEKQPDQDGGTVVPLNFTTPADFTTSGAKVVVASN